MCLNYSHREGTEKKNIRHETRSWDIDLEKKQADHDFHFHKNYFCVAHTPMERERIRVAVKREFSKSFPAMKSNIKK